MRGDASPNDVVNAILEMFQRLEAKHNLKENVVDLNKLKQGTRATIKATSKKGSASKTDDDFKKLDKEGGSSDKNSTDFDGGDHEHADGHGGGDGGESIKAVITDKSHIHLHQTAIELTILAFKKEAFNKMEIDVQKQSEYLIYFFLIALV